MASMPHVNTLNGKDHQFVHMFLFGIITLLFFCLIPRVVEAVQPDINTILMSSTYKIEGENGNVGTVFILGKPSSVGGRYYNVLVTAAHVLDDMNGDSAILFLRRKEGNKYFKTPYLYRIRQNGRRLWVKHSDVDVAAMFIVLPNDSYNWKYGNEIVATDEIIQQFELYPGRELKLLGFPLGFESNEGGFPILRTGSIASFPLIPARELKTFLVDFRIFDGNSGGPVYFHDPDWHQRGSGGIMAPKEVQMILGLVSKQMSITETTKSHMQETTQKYPLSIAEVVHGALIKETVDLLPPVPTADTTSSPIRPISFLDSAITRLQGKVPEESLAQVRSTAATWTVLPTKENLAIASETVTFIASKYNIRSMLTVVSLPQGGATIKYQTVGQRERKEAPTTAKQVTTCVETIPIGRYHIWTERGKKQTSDSSKIYEIINSEEKVEIDESTRLGKAK